MSPHNISKNLSHRAGFLGMRLDSTTASNFRVFPIFKSVSQDGSSLVGGATGLSLEGPSVRLTSEAQCNNPGYKFAPRTYASELRSTRLSAAEDDRPLAAAPMVTLESSSATTLESASLFAQDLRKDL
jgi:hypothetical protein